MAALAERGSATILAKHALSISLLPVVLAAVVVGPHAAMIVGAASMITAPTPVMKWAVFSASGAVSGGVAGLVVMSVPAMDSAFLAAAVAVAAATAAAFTADGLMYLGIAALRDIPVRDSVRVVAPASLVAALLTATILTPLAYAYVEISPWSVWLFVPPAIVAQRLFGLYQEQRELAEGLGKANERLERASLSFARGRARRT